MKKNQTNPIPIGHITPNTPQTSPTNDGVRGATRPTPDHRRFLKLTGATLLADAALPQAAQADHTSGANINDKTSIIYFNNVMTSTIVPNMILNIYLTMNKNS